MNGSSTSAITRSASTRLARICATRGRFAGSFASVNGAVAAIYLLATSSACQMASRARLNAAPRPCAPTACRQRPRSVAASARSAILAIGRRRNVQFAAEIALRHRQHAAGEIAEIVGEVGVVALDQPLVGEIAVEAIDDFAHHEVAQYVGAVRLLILDRIAHVARAFRHPRAAEIQPSVHIEMLKSGQPAASSIGGQYTAWVLRISLPMKCSVTGRISR